MSDTKASPQPARPARPASPRPVHPIKTKARLLTPKPSVVQRGTGGPKVHVASLLTRKRRDRT